MLNLNKTKQKKNEEQKKKERDLMTNVEKEKYINHF